MRPDVPKWAVPLLQPARYKGIYGGRGGGKSHFVAGYIVACHVADPDESTVCVREVQRSLKQSVKKLIEDKIRQMDVADYFDITTTEIRSRFGTGVIVFEGMADHTADSIKSLEGFRRAWIEEAQVISQRSLDLLCPTIRIVGSEIIATWNPETEEDPIDQLLRGPNKVVNAVVVEAHYLSNPWISPDMLEEAENCRRASQSKYDWIWGGKYRLHAQARYFTNWTVQEFDTPKDAQIRLGLDWGFSPHPLAMVGCFIVGRKLYIDREVCEYNCTISNTPGVILQVHEADKLQITAGADRPERIADLKEKGFKVVKAIRGPNSVEQGLEWLETYDIIIHPECTATIEEFKLFSHPVDKLTKKVLPGYVDENNHCIEALRYACEGVRRLAKNKPANVIPLPIEQHWRRSAHG